MKTELKGSHLTTYDTVFQHPISRNLSWRELRSMLGAMSDVTQTQHDKTLKISRNGHSVVLHEPLRKNFDNVRELMDLRRFLEESETQDLKPVATGTHLLVVIDHRLARIYKADVHGSVPQSIIPYDRNGAGRHLHHVEEQASGQRKPEIASFYEAVAKTLQDAEKILLFGSGTGASSAMGQLFAALRRDHPALARLVVGSVIVDEGHLSEDQLLALARTFYANQSLPVDASPH